MDAESLRRTQLYREALGYIALPLGYGALMFAGVFVPSAQLVAISFALVAMLLLQGRSMGVSRRVAMRSAPPPDSSHVSAKALRAADARFLRQINYTLGANAAGYYVFLFVLDANLRAPPAPGSLSSTVLVGAFVGIALVVGGREVARRAAWRPADGATMPVPVGLRPSGPYPPEYLEWRRRAEPRE